MSKIITTRDTTECLPIGVYYNSSLGLIDNRKGNLLIKDYSNSTLQILPSTFKETSTSTSTSTSKRYTPSTVIANETIFNAIKSAYNAIYTKNTYKYTISNLILSSSSSYTCAIYNDADDADDDAADNNIILTFDKSKQIEVYYLTEDENTIYAILAFDYGENVPNTIYGDPYSVCRESHMITSSGEPKSRKVWSIDRNKTLTCTTEVITETIYTLN